MKTAAEVVFVVRTHYFDDEIRDIYARLALSRCRVCLVVDELAQPVPVDDGFLKLSLNAETLGELGLPGFPRVGWQCGDYAFYVARRAFPDAKRFWLIEPDVFINAADSFELFDFFDGHAEVDFLGCFFERAKPRWHWYPAMHAHEPEVFRCLYPLVRLSACAVDAVYAERVKMSATVDMDRLVEDSIIWPNDESISATTFVAKSLVCKDINAFGRRFYNVDTFSLDRPISRSSLRRKGADGLIYHPVLSGSRFSGKMDYLLDRLRKRKRLKVLAIFDSALLKDLRQECGDDVAEAFVAALNAAKAAVSWHPLTAFLKLRAYTFMKKMSLKVRGRV